MFCKKCGNEIKEGERFCSKCGTNTDKKSLKKPIIICSIIAVICIIAVIVGIYLIKTNYTSVETGSSEVDSKQSNNEETKGFEQASINIENNIAEKVSFANLSIDDESLNEIQKDIVNYFDNNYFAFYSKDAQKYPQIFQNAKVTTSAAVVKVLKSTNDEFEVLAVDCGQGAYNYYENAKIEDIPVEQLLVISGKQLSERVSTNDIFYLYGRYIDVESRDIDGKSYMVSKLQANNIVKNEQTVENIGGFTVYSSKEVQKYSYNTLKNIAEYIFGKDIKVNEAVEGQDYKTDDGNFYKITLDNQSNVNFKVFNMYKNKGLITYNKIHNGLSDNIQKRLFISADFQHYIVTTYDEGTKHVYIDYFDRQLNKVWNRQFDYTSTKAFVSPIDYNDSKMAIVVDNDLYLIDLETGENVIEPVIVGEKIKVNMMKDGIILIGDNNKDTIMKVDYTGKIVFKLNANTSMSKIDSAELQIVNEKLLLRIWGYSQNSETALQKFIVINNEGKIETSSEDLSSFV